MKRIIHVVGLQKSGTSLLVRLLENSGITECLGGRGKTEGGIDWGNRPSFAPTEFPAGLVYQRTAGRDGHEIDGVDATPEVIDHVHRDVHKRLDSLQAPLGVSKCPYSSVRLPWVRAILPDLFVVAIVRKPLPNAFSLLKRYRSVRGMKEPEDGWWGVKPKGWMEMISDDKATQVATQWLAVNTKLWDDQSLVDRFVHYEDLCSSPTDTVEAILGSALGRSIALGSPLPILRDCDDEYLHGGGLQPKRSQWIDSNKLVLTGGEEPEMPPLSPDEIDKIISICSGATKILRLGDE